MEKLLLIFSYEKEQIEKLAQRLGVEIPCDISIVAWPLPILLALEARTLRLQQELAEYRLQDARNALTRGGKP